MYSDGASGLSVKARGWLYLAEQIELLVQWGADLHQSTRAGLRLVEADSPDPDVSHVSDVQGSVGGHGQRGGGFEAGVTGVACVAWGRRKQTLFPPGLTLYQPNGVSGDTWRETSETQPPRKKVQTTFQENRDPAELQRLSVRHRRRTCWDTAAAAAASPPPPHLPPPPMSGCNHLDSDPCLIRRGRWVTLVAQQENRPVEPFRLCQQWPAGL